MISKILLYLKSSVNLALNRFGYEVRRLVNHSCALAKPVFTSGYSNDTCEAIIETFMSGIGVEIIGANKSPVNPDLTNYLYFNDINSFFLKRIVPDYIIFRPDINDARLPRIYEYLKLVNYTGFIIIITHALDFDSEDYSGEVSGFNSHCDIINKSLDEQQRNQRGYKILTYRLTNKHVAVFKYTKTSPDSVVYEIDNELYYINSGVCYHILDETGVESCRRHSAGFHIAGADGTYYLDFKGSYVSQN